MHVLAPHHRNTLQHTATHTAIHCKTLQHNTIRVTTNRRRQPARSLQHIYCSTLQHAATCCNTLRHTATHCNSLQQTAAHCNTQNTLPHPATPCNTLPHPATHCNTLQDKPYASPRIAAAKLPGVRNTFTATHCNTLQHTATHRNTLQHTATHCNTLQHTHATCKTRWQILGLQLAARMTQTRANKDSIGRSRCRVRLRLASVERGALQTRSVRLPTEEALLMMQVYGTARAKDRGDLKYRLPTKCEEPTPS